MKAPEDLSKEELVQIVAVIQEVLWLDMDAESAWQFNPDKEWDVDMLDRIADEMHKYGLRPSTMIELDSDAG